jgi:formamidopyrimidine-DNA glycosylase
MPELPEVNEKKRHFNEFALNKKIQQVDLTDVSYILKNIEPAAFAEKLSGRQFVSSSRRGKYFFARLDNDDHVLFHFGMSGRFRYYEEMEDRPKHERFAFEFDNGFRLGFDCPRKLARIHYITDLANFIKDKKLGEDALDISQEAFLKQMEGKKGTLKGFLLNQKYLAGMGNLYADEVCWQLHIHPASTVDALSQELREKIHARMIHILQTAVKKHAVYAEYPDEWMWNHRNKDDTCPRDGTEWEVDKVAGRTTYYCPQCQELISSE